MGISFSFPAGAFVVTSGSDRRESGAHYTPKSLTEAIVAETLTPVVYIGPAEGLPRDKWVLKSPTELLDLKICDPAMGSGAFLVQACRWLADRVVEAWEKVEVTGKTVSVDGEVLDTGVVKEPMPRDSDIRTLFARRLIAERCLYGVDLNPLAVELAKLSIWLVTLAKGRPFGFLDHNLRCGDSLLGVMLLEQLTELSMTLDGKGQQQLFGQNIKRSVHEAIELRQQLRAMSVRDILDVEAMARLDSDARKRLEVPERIADAFIGEVLANAGNAAVLENHLITLAIQSAQAIDGNQEALSAIANRAASTLAIEKPTGHKLRKPFHWPLEFPEIFSKAASGFDAVIGNPPFSGGKKISGSNGEDYREYLVTQIANSVRGNADLVAYFILRVRWLTKYLGALGLVTTNSASEGDTRDVGLSQITARNAEIYQAVRSEPWNGSANVFTSRIHCYVGDWNGTRYLDGEIVNWISDSLTPRKDWKPVKLKANEGLCFQGSIILGLGFTMSPERAQEILHAHPEYKEVVLFPYLIGKELNSKAIPNPERWVINFWDWPESDAKRYPLLYEQVKNLVFPERDALKDNTTAKGYREKWWLFGRDGKNLYHSVGRGWLFQRHPKGNFPEIPMTSVISFSTGATKYPCFTFIENNYVFANSLCVIASSSPSLFACLSSDIHGVWAFEHGSRLKDDLRYAHGDIFETFPFPSGVLEGEKSLDEIGQAYFNARQEYLLQHNKGMTKFYNDLHNETLDTPEIANCRCLHAKLSESILVAYGFSDIDLDYGFREVPYLPERDRVRYTMSEDARQDILTRLAELNRCRHELEANQLIAGTLSNKKPGPGRVRESFHTNVDLFAGGNT